MLMCAAVQCRGCCGNDVLHGVNRLRPVSLAISLNMFQTVGERFSRFGEKRGLTEQHIFFTAIFHIVQKDST